MLTLHIRPSVQPETDRRLSHSVESRPHGSVAVHRGPLHYAYDIARSQTVLARNAQEPRAIDLEFDATGPWQFAIDPSTLTFHGSAPSGGKLPSPIFDSGLPPFTITATACSVDWAVAGDTFAAAPPTNPACKGPATNITLWPFGVRIAVSDLRLMNVHADGDFAFRSRRNSASESSQRSRLVRERMHRRPA